MLPFIRIWFVTLLVAAILLAGCAIDSRRFNSSTYRVNKNETLYAIAWRYKLDHREIARWNNIPAPYTIHPGQSLVLVDPDHRPGHKANPQKATRQTTAKKPAVVKKPANKVVPVKTGWYWPANGKIVKNFKGAKSSSPGIDIAGQLGQPVLAAASGKVVYSGSGLAGYGKLVIVKHNETYLSAYAHNSELLVKEGDSVASGGRIAKMGLSSQQYVRLHFEIRKHGKPVDPLKYLPRR